MLNKSDFNKAVELYSDKLYGYMLKLVRDKDEAKNWTQEAYTILWEKRAEVNPEKVKSFLFTTAYRKMIDQYRRTKRQAELATNFSSNVANAEKGYENKQLLNRAFENMTENHKAMLLLRDYEGYDYQSIAEICQMSLGNVKVNLFRARKQMKIILEKLMNEKEVKND